jgi:adenine-specific DNA-methyltransferase
MNKSVSSKHVELVTKLREIFQIDRPELNFGIYRILNARAREINDYLQNRLLDKVRNALGEGAQAQKEQVAQELQEKEAHYRADGMNPDDVPRIKELREKLAQYIAGSNEHENAVFSHLLTFFSRYYDNGDFISQRRYKGDTYAIPYSGEEVVLHWANKDQYYTKSGENFSNYSFKLEDGRTVNFRLVAADTAKDNRKDNDKERRFALVAGKTVTRQDENGDEYEEEILPVEEMQNTEGDKELVVRFEYASQVKGTKQEALVTKAVEAVLGDPAVKARWLELGNRSPTEKSPQRTLLEKHLRDYTTKNTADFFIHKELGGFLRRELDFYIKNEVMHLDDVQNADAFADIEKNLRMIQCLRSIALELITFLAQLEDFQKKLWLKKKFVVSSHYCITLDLVPESLWPEVLTNERQWAQWKQLGVWDGVAPGAVEDLKAAPYRMVDTSLFAAEFKAALLQQASSIDSETNGLLIHSDNFQALNLLKCKYYKKIKTIYIDPPYNTNASEILYKNGFRKSSWISLVENRLKLGLEFLCDDGIHVFTIDDFELDNSLLLLHELFDRQNHLATVPIRNNPQGRSTVAGFSVNHEYAVFHRKSSSSSIGRLSRSETQDARYDEIDELGRRYLWENFRKTGTDSARTDRPKQYYPIWLDESGQISIPELVWNESNTSWQSTNAPQGVTVLWPNDQSGVHRVWKWGLDRFKREISYIKVERVRGSFEVYRRNYVNEEGKLPGTWWDDSNYAAGSHGTNVLSGMFGNERNFLFPKSYKAVADCLKVAALDDDECVLDYFAGSGSTGQAVISMNRLDGSNRKYILVEQGDYFGNVLVPRIKKTVYSSDWSDSKPTDPASGISHCLKVLKLESYEDTLNNLQLRRTVAQGDLLSHLPEHARDDYLLSYMLDVESRGALLSVEDFKKPFDYALNIAVDSAGAFEPHKVDLVETFNYLIGLRVKHIDAQHLRGFVTVTGTLPGGESCLVLWRDCEMIDYDELRRMANRLDIEAANNPYAVIYINGDHNIPASYTPAEGEDAAGWAHKIRPIEPEFLERMFSVEDI